MRAWQELLDSEKYDSVKEMAEELGVYSSCIKRLLRSTTLRLDIIESKLNGREHNAISQTKLIGKFPSDWSKQRKMDGVMPDASGSNTEIQQVKREIADMQCRFLSNLDWWGKLYLQMSTQARCDMEGAIFVLTY